MHHTWHHVLLMIILPLLRVFRTMEWVLQHRPAAVVHTGKRLSISCLEHHSHVILCFDWNTFGLWYLYNLSIATLAHAQMPGWWCKHRIAEHCSAMQTRQRQCWACQSIRWRVLLLRLWSPTMRSQHASSESASRITIEQSTERSCFCVLHVLFNNINRFKNAPAKLAIELQSVKLA